MKNIQFLPLAALILGGLTVGRAEAAIRPYALSLTPFAGGYLFEGNQRYEDEPVYGLAIGYNLGKRWGLEASGGHIESRVKVGPEDDIDVYLLHLDMLCHFRSDKDFVPYVAAGLGGISTHLGGSESEEAGLFNYGLGFKYFLKDSLALRVDARHLITGNTDQEEDNRDVFNNLAYTAGLTFQFGGAKEEPRLKDTDGDGVADQFDRCPDTKLGVPVDGFGCPLDSDRDEVPDFMDSCPDTPPGVKVDKRGCPPDGDGDGISDHLDRCPGTPKGTAVDETGCPRAQSADADGDGVVDGRDKCPNTPAYVPVNDFGCPRDSDDDGVFDVDDRCPGTPQGISVGPDGCPAPAAIPDSLVLQLEFNSGEAAIRPDFAPRLREAADFIEAHPDSRILIEGHTDSVGSNAANQALSRQRAENVRRYLIENFRIAPAKLEARGFGEEQPIADNATPEGRQENRRVVVTAVPE